MKSTPCLLSRALIICLCGGVFYCMAYLMEVSLSVMIDSIMQHFHCNLRQMALMGSCFFYGAAIMLIPAGMLLDRWPNSYPIGWAMLVWGLSVLLFSFTQSYNMAVLMRFVIGASSAFSFIGTISLIRRYLPSRNFATAIGVLQLLGALGAMLGQAPLLLFYSRVGWQWGLAILACVVFAFATLLVVMQRSGQQSLSHVVSDHPKGMAFATYRHHLTNYKLWIIVVCGVLSWVPVGTLGALWGVPFLKVHFHILTIKAGQMMVLFWLGLATTPVIGYLADATQSAIKIMIGNFLLATVAVFVLLYTHSIFASYVALYCLGLSCSSQAITMLLVRRWFPEEVFSGLCGLLNVAVVIGSGAAQYFVGVLMVRMFHGHESSASLYPLSMYQHALLLIPLSAVLGLILSLILSRKNWSRGYLSSRSNNLYEG